MTSASLVAEDDGDEEVVDVVDRAELEFSSSPDVGAELTAGEACGGVTVLGARDFDVREERGVAVGGSVVVFVGRLPAATAASAAAAVTLTTDAVAAAVTEAAAAASAAAFSV